MKLKSTLCAALAAISLAPSLPALAHEATLGALTIDHPAARPNLPNRPTAAYMAIMNAGDAPDRLLSATSPMFETIELHTIRQDNGVMKMEPVDAFEIPAGGRADLAPGGNHLMLFGADTVHKIGDSFPVTLTFENAGEVTVEVRVEKIDTGHGGASHGSTGDHSHGHTHGSTSD